MMAIRQLGVGHHFVVDPFQADCYGIGATRAQLLKMQDHFTLIEQESAAALPRLAADALQFQLIFIDGKHRFDNALVDFFLADAICPVGGVIVLDDMWMQSIQKVVGFITKNRSDYSCMSTDVGNAAVFRKIDRDERPWDHYVDF